MAGCRADVWLTAGGAEDVKRLVRLAFRRDGRTPDYIVVHVGSSDLVQTSSFEVRDELYALWLYLRCFPDSPTLVWSDILPRWQGRHHVDWDPSSVARLDSIRKDTNRFCRRMAIRYGGQFITHEWAENNRLMFQPDGLHLTRSGRRRLVTAFLASIGSPVGGWGGGGGSALRA